MACCSEQASYPETREPIKYDPHFCGPVKNRSCTDVFWLLLFLAFVSGWIYVGVHGIQKGDVRRLLAPEDSQGHRCGLDSGFQSKPYLVFFDITKCATPDVAITGCPTPQVCVEQCPDTTILFGEVLNPDSRTFSRLVCKYDVDKSAINTREQMMRYIDGGNCSAYTLSSQSILSRCIGSDLSTLSCKRGAPPAAELCLADPARAQSALLARASALDTYVGLVAAGWVTFFTRSTPEIQDMSTRIVEDLVAARYYMLGAAGGVVALCFLYILLLRWVVAPAVWFSLVGFIAILSFAVYKCYQNYVNYKSQLRPTTNLSSYLENVFYKKETWMALMIICASLAVILILIVIFLRKRLAIAIALIKEGSKAVCANTSTVAYPLLPWLLQCAALAYGLVSLVFLLSVGESQYRVVGKAADADCICLSYQDGESCTPREFSSQCHSQATNQQCINATCHFDHIQNPIYVNYFLFVNVFGFFWLMFFIQGMADLTLAGTFAQWYWTFNKRNVPYFLVTKAMYTSIRYHMGTVAFGSLIIALVRIIRLFLEYVDRKLKKYDNSLTKAVLCMCKCCFYCLENFLKFINKNAYIMCAVHGTNFCTSARDAFSLLMRNILRVFVLDKVTDFIFVVSKLLIAAGTGAAVYYLSGWSYLYSELGAERLHYNAVPAVVMATVAYFVATLFFNVYAVAVLTLFHCFLEDCERNDGSSDKPYFMSRNLMKVLGQRNKHE